MSPAAASRRSMFALLFVLILAIPSLATAGAGETALRTLTGSAAWARDGQTSSALGAALATVGDLNGDGMSDFALGAPSYDDPNDGLSALGAVEIYFGVPTGLPAATPSQTVYGLPSSSFGAALAPAGDVNGDGFDDLVVGAPTRAFDGTVFLYLGSPSGLQVPAAWSYTYLDAGLVGARLGATVCTAGDVDADGYDDVVVGAPDSGDFKGAAFLFLGNPSTGLSVGPTWSVSGGNGWRMGASVSTAGDVDADGYADVIVGAPGYGSPDATGACFFYRGGWPGGSQGPPGLTPFGSLISVTQFGATFGSSVALAGDVNGDGYADVVIGAPTYDAFSLNDCGRASVHLGGAAGLTEAPYWEEYGITAGAGFGAIVACAGDVDGDGLGDVLAAAPAYSGGLANQGYAVLVQGSRSAMFIRWNVYGQAASERFGTAMAAAGDVDGDGFGDVLVGTPNAASGSGRARLYRGAADAPSSTAGWQWTGQQPQTFWSWVVDAAGDLNGDGYDDLVVTGPGYDAYLADDGIVVVYFGAPQGPHTGGSPGAPATWFATGEVGGQSFGYSASCAGDVNGDGYDDLVVGAPLAAGRGRAYVWYGGPVGPSLGAANVVLDGPHADSRFGWSVADAGDVNGDGFADLMVGAPGATEVLSGEGKAFLYLGSSAGLSTTADWSMRGGQEFAGLGNSVSGAGDVNGDGYSDMIVGMELWDRPFALGWVVDVGLAHVVHGAPGGPSSFVLNTTLQGESNDRFGTVVAHAGDVNGDGFSDVIVTAIGRDPSDSGAAYVFAGSAAGILPVAYWTFSTGQAFSGLGVAAASAGDVNRDGYSDVIVGANFHDSSGRNDNGAVWLFQGPLTGDAAITPLWQRTGAASFENLGQSVAGIGDVNGDGFGDVATGATGFTQGFLAEGRVQVHWGNGGTVSPAVDDGVQRRVRQRRSGDLGPVALGGRTTGGPQFLVELVGHSAAGRAPVRLQYQSAGVGAPLVGTLLTSMPWTDGQPGGAGSAPVLDSAAIGANAQVPTLWRARVQTSSPFFPVSPWFTMARNGVREADLRGGVSATAVDLPSVTTGTLALRAVPNPFNPRTAIEFDLAEPTEVRVTVFDARGRRVVQLVDETRDAGPQSVIWDGTDDRGQKVSSGTYHARVWTARSSGVTKLALVR